MSNPETFDEFLKRIPGLASLERQELARYFIYFLTTSDPSVAATPVQVAGCFRQAELTPWDDVRFYMARASQKQSRSDTPRLIHIGTGYRLERGERERIRSTLLGEPHEQETDAALQSLVGRVAPLAEKSFLAEAVLCYEIKAYRAAIIMTWNLALDHLHEFILKHKLAEFNTELAKVTDKRVKANVITSKDDFGDIPENKFIEIARAAKIISNDIRKILDTKLGIRNSYAHPSTLTLPPITASEFIQDLINNVVLKFTV